MDYVTRYDNALLHFTQAMVNQENVNDSNATSSMMPIIAHMSIRPIVKFTFRTSSYSRNNIQDNVLLVVLLQGQCPIATSTFRTFVSHFLITFQDIVLLVIIHSGQRVLYNFEMSY